LLYFQTTRPVSAQEDRVQAIVRWVVMPRRSEVAIINAGLDVWMAVEGFDPLDSRRLQVCVEGVFSYCVGTIRAGGGTEDIAVTLFRLDDRLRVLIQHSGPSGEWDDCLKLDTSPAIKRTSFDAMGLFIAKELLCSLFAQDL
jgi:hypothetical protein